MRQIAGGTFLMGSDRHYADESPAHKVPVGGFWIDETTVTNADYAAFVAATGYVTVAVEIHHSTASAQLPTGSHLSRDFMLRHSLGDVPDHSWKACVKALLSAKFSANATSPTGSGVRDRSSRATE